MITHIGPTMKPPIVNRATMAQIMETAPYVTESRLSDVERNAMRSKTIPMTNQKNM